MRKFAIAAVAVLAIAGSTAVYAQHRHWGYGHSRMSPEDRAAYADARIAAVHAGLKLTADQEKLWPPVETAVRELAKLRIDFVENVLCLILEDLHIVKGLDRRTPLRVAVKLDITHHIDTHIPRAQRLDGVALAAALVDTGSGGDYFLLDGCPELC